MLEKATDLTDPDLIAEYQRWRALEARIKKGQMYTWERDRMNEVAAEVKKRMIPFAPEPPETYLKD